MREEYSHLEESLKIATRSSYITFRDGVLKPLAPVIGAGAVFEYAYANERLMIPAIAVFAASLVYAWIKTSSVSERVIEETDKQITALEETTRLLVAARAHRRSISEQSVDDLV